MLRCSFRANGSPRRGRQFLVVRDVMKHLSCRNGQDFRRSALSYDRLSITFETTVTLPLAFRLFLTIQIKPLRMPKTSPSVSHKICFLLSRLMKTEWILSDILKQIQAMAPRLYEEAAEMSESLSLQRYGCSRSVRIINVAIPLLNASLYLCFLP